MDKTFKDTLALHKWKAKFSVHRELTQMFTASDKRQKTCHTQSAYWGGLIRDLP